VGACAFFSLAAFALDWTVSAQADCPTTGLPATFIYETITVSNSLAVGAVMPGTVRSFRLSGKCSGSNLSNVAIVSCPSSRSPVSDTADVYSTGSPGVGMRMLNSRGTALIGSGVCGPNTSVFSKVGACGCFTVSGTFELVKTGTIAAGTITPSLSTGTCYSGVYSTGVPRNNGPGASALSIAAGTTVRPVTCSVTSATANQTILIIQASPSAQGSAGAVAARTPFRSVSVEMRVSRSPCAFPLLRAVPVSGRF
jgi:hypothetical protein